MRRQPSRWPPNGPRCVFRGLQRSTPHERFLTQNALRVQGYLRKANACEGLKRWDTAIDAYKKIVSLETSSGAHNGDAPSSSADAKRAALKVKQLETRSMQAPKPRNGAVQKGFFAGKTTSIYEEKEDFIKEIVDPVNGETRFEAPSERTWRFMLRRLKAGCNTQGVNANGDRVVLDDGVFAKLLQESEFQKLIYPGIPKAQLAHVPQNLQALLEDPWYEEELLLLMPKVQEKAESVLANVKKRGAAQGEFMDSATEAKLLPQVLQEAFGREVLAMVHRVNYKKHMMMANDERTLADPTSEFASWDQLSSAFLDDLLVRTSGSGDDKEETSSCARVPTGVAVMDGFMGEEWTELLIGDVQRMAKNNLLMDMATSVDGATRGRDAGSSSSVAANGAAPAAGNGRMRFVEQSDCQREYPAVAELLEKVHALPYEINRKRPENAKLCAQFAHCTSINQLRKGEAQRLRLDCGAGEKDNGFKLTCMYFFNGDSSRSRAESKLEVQAGPTMNVRTDLFADGAVQRIPPRADRLVMFQSQRVYNEITTIPSEDEELFYLTFWIHGKELR